MPTSSWGLSTVLPTYIVPNWVTSSKNKMCAGLSLLPCEPLCRNIFALQKFYFTLLCSFSFSLEKHKSKTSLFSTIAWCVSTASPSEQVLQCEHMQRHRLWGSPEAAPCAFHRWVPGNRHFGVTRGYLEVGLLELATEVLVKIKHLWHKMHFMPVPHPNTLLGTWNDYIFPS